ncbi:glyoxalase [Nocardioides marinus]|uniref:Glyoxalase/Bleomycin resistance protein/Dioxygenase superfamily protein n=1 Tax=Nocardioides marinus TaxID=374514 RepID=A0A7Y9YH19_9ACTN|nr:glyoxalase [Nocardioides marinus]NYI11127.1 hypothetical protein [Nocardioides marinus]
MSITVEELQVADTAEAWERAGFAVTDDVCRVGRLRVRLLGPGADRGIVGWTLAGLPSGVPTGEVDGIATTVAPREADPPAPPTHPNGVTHLDHVVLMTPDLPRTVTALGELGLTARRERDGELGGVAVRQVFYRLEDVIVEVVGPPEPSDGPDTARPARLWGLTHVAADLGVAVGLLGELAGTPKDAVQPGRRITTLRTRELGMSVRTALITPHVRSR